MLTVQRLLIAVSAAIVLITALYVRKISVRLSSKTQVDKIVFCVYINFAESTDLVIAAKQRVLTIASAQVH